MSAETLNDKCRNCGHSRDRHQLGANWCRECPDVGCKEYVSPRGISCDYQMGSVDIAQCTNPIAHECVCGRCSHEDAENTFHACEEHKDHPSIANAHLRTYGPNRQIVWTHSKGKQSVCVPGPNRGHTTPSERFKLPATDMAHYRLLVSWRKMYRHDLKNREFAQSMQNGSVRLDRIALYEEVCDMIAKLRARAT